MDSICHRMRIKPSNVLAFMHDSAASNLLSFADTLQHVFVFSEDTHTIVAPAIDYWKRTSLFNATYDDDQKRSHADYIELSMQSQFNKRGLR